MLALQLRSENIMKENHQIYQPVPSIKAFSNENGNLRKIVTENGDILFCGKDVCDGLEHKNHRVALGRLDDDEKDYVNIADAIGRMRDTLFITEPGLYRLISTSRTSKAKCFQRWVFHEVLPAIRKTGSYSISKVVNDPIMAAIERDRKMWEEHLQLRDRVDLIETEREEARQFLNALPEPVKSSPEASVRMRVNEAVRKYSLLSGIRFQHVWRKLYREFRYNHNIDLVVRAKNSGLKPLDLADKLGMMDELYALAYRLLVEELDGEAYANNGVEL